MPLFKLIEKKFVDGEWRWTYSVEFSFTFNQNKIQQINITDHYRIKHKKLVNNELILGILTEIINGEVMRPHQRHNNQDVYVQEWIAYRERDYRLIFWFKHGTTDHLWIRNCYPQD